MARVRYTIQQRVCLVQLYFKYESAGKCRNSRTPCHDETIGVWCEMSARRVTGPIFYDDTVNVCEHHPTPIFSPS
jgi:hypothetical protein